MELPNIGKICAQSSCKQLDFLPLQCECGKIFCSGHFSIHTQTCKISKSLKEDELKTIEDVFLCSQRECPERSIVPLICERCHKHFCIKHRHIAECKEKNPEELAEELKKYTVPVKRFEEAKAVVDRQIESALKDAKKKSKNRDMANKVMLMKLKNKAVGSKSIPVADRVYLNITYFDSNNAVKLTPVFVSNTWTVGRAIDAIAQEMRLPNHNNKLNEKKLRLFKMDDSEIICKNVSTILNDLLNDKIIINGDNLIIQHVTDDCVKINLQ